MTALSDLLARERECDILSAALITIRRKVHAHNRGGELSAGLRNEIRNICDLAFAKVRSELSRSPKVTDDGR